MLSRKDRARFASYCKLTCLGGSEQGTCSCKCPADCEMRHHPYFEEARAKAQQCMLRILRAGLELCGEKDSD